MDEVILENLETFKDIIDMTDLDEYLSLFGFENANVNVNLHKLTLTEIYLIDVLFMCLNEKEKNLILPNTLLHLSKLKERKSIERLSGYIVKFGISLLEKNEKDACNA